jgi:hypothetical protein
MSNANNHLANSIIQMVTVPDDDQWHFDISHFRVTPSRVIDNITAAQELKARSDGVHFLLRCGNALKLLDFVCGHSESDAIPAENPTFYQVQHPISIGFTCATRLGQVGMTKL